MNLYVTKKEHYLLVEVYKHLNAEGSRPDLAASLLRTINRLDKKLEKQEQKPPRRARPVKAPQDDRPLMKLLLEAGYPAEEMDHHESDLYVYVTPLTTRVVESWCKAHGYSPDWHCPTFRDQITGRLMYDIAFQYIPYWEERSEKNENAGRTEEHKQPANF